MTDTQNKQRDSNDNDGIGFGTTASRNLAHELARQRAGDRTQHTPGPWTITQDNGDAAECARPSVIIETEDKHVAFCFSDDMPTARLIAAAPELLAACKLLVSRFKTEGGKYVKAAHVIAVAEAAIVKAEGSAQ